MKHFLWKTTIDFQSEELELTSVLSKELKKPYIAPTMEPHWVLKEWDKLMAFMLCGTHLERKAHTLENWETEDSDLPRSFCQKGKNPITPTKGRKNRGEVSSIFEEDEEDIEEAEDLP